MEDDKWSDFTINYDKLIGSTDMLAITRLLATHLSKNPYYSIGEFLKNLSDSDLELLMEIDATGEDDPRVGDIILIAEMLAAAEGVNDRDLDTVVLRAGQMQVFITLESLYRKKLVKLYRENMSFGEDAGDKIICEPIAS